ncbi:hypothetical protein FQN54_008011, partial [Arachnomyces sp. PD_36]
MKIQSKLKKARQIFEESRVVERIVRENQRVKKRTEREKFDAINVNEKTEKKYDKVKKSATLHEFLKKIKEKIIKRECVIIIRDMFNQSLDITLFFNARNVLTEFEKKIDDNFLRLTLESFSKTNSLRKRKIKSFRLIVRVSRMLALSFSQSFSINSIVIVDEQNFISISSFQSEFSQIKSIVKISSKKNKVSSFDFVKTTLYSATFSSG